MSTSRQDKVIDTLVTSRDPMGASAIAKKLGTTASNISAILRKLYTQGYLKRSLAPNNGYRYRVAPGVVKTPGGYSLTGEDVGHHDPVSSQQMLQLLRGWAVRKWNPKIFQSAGSLPLCVAELFKIASRMAYGEHVDPEELDSVQGSIAKFAGDLKSALKVVEMIQAAPELKDVYQISEFLLSGQDVTTIQTLAASVENTNRPLDTEVGE